MVRVKANFNYQSIKRNIEETSTINSQSTNSNHPVIIRLDRNKKTKRAANNYAHPHFEEAFNAYSLKNQMLNKAKRYTEEGDHRSKTPA